MGACLVGLAGEHSEGIFGFRRTVREQVEEVLRDSCSECVCSSAALGLSSGLAQFLDCQVAVRVLARRSCPGVIRVGICVRKRGARSAFDIWIKSTTLDDILKSGGLSRKGRNGVAHLSMGEPATKVFRCYLLGSGNIRGTAMGVSDGLIILL